MNSLIQTLPKAELHVHLLGTLEPYLFLQLAHRNNIATDYATVQEVRQAFKDFNNLDQFLEIYFQASQLMQTEQDFYDVTLAYLKKASQQGVLHAEIFFEAQTHMPRGIPFSTIINGINKAINQAHNSYNITALPILCFLRHLSQESALKILQESLPFKDKIIAIGLAANEHANPPSKFTKLFAQAKKYGYKLCAHAGEDAGPDYIWQAINELHVDRIDHGIRCIEDPNLVTYLTKEQIPLTVCPLSNIHLNIFTNQQDYPLKKLMNAGLNISINSDDPAFFGGYINENYQEAQRLGLTNKQLVQSARNSFMSSFVPDDQKNKMLQKLDDWIKNQKH
ncbi:MAG: adenosine deaminase [Candidatus Dependentiae bacterium]